MVFGFLFNYNINLFIFTSNRPRGGFNPGGALPRWIAEVFHLLLVVVDHLRIPMKSSSARDLLDKMFLTMDSY